MISHIEEVVVITTDGYSAVQPYRLTRSDFTLEVKYHKFNTLEELTQVKTRGIYEPTRATYIEEVLVD